jgi:uncharacterized protein (DUF433 family)
MSRKTPADQGVTLDGVPQAHDLTSPGPLCLLHFVAQRRRSLPYGVRMRGHSIVALRAGLGGPRPALVGTRLDVWQVAETVRTEGGIEEAASYLGAPVAKVRAAMRYYAAFKDEVDQWTRRARERAEAEEQAWRTEREIPPAAAPSRETAESDE